jgi:hypothetical protein
MFPNTPSIFGAGASGGGGAPGTTTKKSGVVTGVSFAGNPKTFAVIFAAPYADADYIISLSGVDSRLYTFETKSAAGFTINTNANTAVTGDVNWFTTPAGEFA